MSAQNSDPTGVQVVPSTSGSAGIVQPSDRVYGRLCFAVNHGLQEEADYLLSDWLKRVDKYEYSSRLLELAATHNAAILQRLLGSKSVGPFKTSDLATALEAAVEVGHMEAVRVLIQYSERSLLSERAAGQRNALHVAAECGKTEVLLELLELLSNSLDLEASDEDGNTPLMVSAAKGHDITLLVKKGASPTTSNNDGETILHITSRLHQHHVLTQLLVNEDCLNLLEKLDKRKYTPLMAAVAGGCTKCMLLLIEAGANQHFTATDNTDNTNKSDKTDNTDNTNNNSLPRLAIMHGHVEILKLFLADENEQAARGIQQLITKEDELNVLLHLAVKHRASTCIQYLLLHGANMASHYTLGIVRSRPVLKEMLNLLPNCEQVLQEVFNDCVEVKPDQVVVNFQVLHPRGERKMTVPRLLYQHRENQQLLQHPLLLTFIALEWEQKRYYTWYQLSTYLLYTICMTLYVCMPEDYISRDIMAALTWPLALHVLLFIIPNFFPGVSLRARLYNLIFTFIPPITTLIMVELPYNVEWCSVAILSTWLSLPMYVTIIPKINYQAAMFHSVIKEMVNFSIVFIYVLIAFSLTFFILYYERENNFRNFGQAFLYTIVVLLQGGMDGTPIFESPKYNSTNTQDDSSDETWTHYLTSVLRDMRFAGIVASLLFVFVCILALLNMLVGLAVRGSKELMDEGIIHHLGSKVNWLYEWEPIFLHVINRLTKQNTEYESSREIKATDIPISMYNQLRNVQLTDKYSTNPDP